MSPSTPRSVLCVETPHHPPTSGGSLPSLRPAALNLLAPVTPPGPICVRSGHPQPFPSPLSCSVSPPSCPLPAARRPRRPSSLRPSMRSLPCSRPLHCPPEGPSLLTSVPSRLACKHRHPSETLICTKGDPQPPHTMVPGQAPPYLGSSPRWGHQPWSEAPLEPMSSWASGGWDPGPWAQVPQHTHHSSRLCSLRASCPGPGSEQDPGQGVGPGAGRGCAGLLTTPCAAGLTIQLQTTHLEERPGLRNQSPTVGAGTGTWTIRSPPHACSQAPEPPSSLPRGTAGATEGLLPQPAHQPEALGGVGVGAGPPALSLMTPCLRAKPTWPCVLGTQSLGLCGEGWP